MKAGYKEKRIHPNHSVILCSFAQPVWKQSVKEMIMKYLLVFVTVLCMLGCVSSRQKYTQKVNVWIGRNVDTLIESDWGYPDRTTAAPSGNRLLVYYDYEPVFRSHYLYSWERLDNDIFIVAPNGYSDECITFFEIDDAGKIINARWRGDGCW